MKKKVWLIILAVIFVIGAITTVFVIRNNQDMRNPRWQYVKGCFPGCPGSCLHPKR